MNSERFLTSSPAWFQASIVETSRKQLTSSLLRVAGVGVHSALQDRIVSWLEIIQIENMLLDISYIGQRCYRDASRCD